MAQDGFLAQDKEAQAMHLSTARCSVCRSIVLVYSTCWLSAHTASQGNSGCWSHQFNYETCCLRDEPSCWDSTYTRKNCCDTEGGDVPGYGSSSGWKSIGVDARTGFLTFCGATRQFGKDFFEHAGLTEAECCGNDVVDQDLTQLTQIDELRRFDTGKAASNIHAHLHSDAVRGTAGLDQVFLLSDVLRVHRPMFIKHLKDPLQVQAAADQTR